MWHRALVGVVALALLTVLASSEPSAQVPPAGRGASGPTGGVACLVIDVRTGRALIEEHADWLGTPILPGSVLKIATLTAALESGLIQADTRIACRRRLSVDGRTFTCVHPDVGHALTPAEALAYSCNYFYASVAARLNRSALDRAMVGLGLTPSPSFVPLVAAGLGLEGTKVTPRQLLTALVRLTTAGAPAGSTMHASTRTVLFDGLRGAADFGTAKAFHDGGLTAFAKTGTAPMPGGGYHGLVVAVTPADRPERAVVVLAPGGAGVDAAEIAVQRLTSLDKPPAQGVTLRIGQARRTGGGYDVVTIPLEEYVARVVGGESVPSSGLEARKALAIAARTYAMVGIGRHAREGFDLCDLTHCQVLGPMTSAGREAAERTAGKVLYDRDSLAQVYYTASCGGVSETPSAVWPGAVDPSYLVSRPEPECRADSAWQSDVTARNLESVLRAMGSHGDVLRGLRVASRTGSGHVALMRADAFAPTEIAGEAFRLAVGRMLGWQVLKSTLFDLERTATGYRFTGSGRGHGVGLCVTGSARLAAAGKSAEAILQSYYPGLQIRDLAARPSGPKASPPTKFEISVPAGEERERERLEELAAESVREATRKGAVPPPPVIRIVVHPTVEAYHRSTGQPWWTAGATKGHVINLLPVASLRNQHLLERTLRHEVAHVVIGTRLDGRPRWVQEAAAMFLAGELDVVAESAHDAKPLSGAGCPADAEWVAGSRDSMDRAYRRAAECFRSALAAGRRWDGIGTGGER